MELNTERLVNAEGVSDHTALLPTKNIASINFEELNLSENEKKVLELVYQNLKEATSKPYKYKKTTVTISYRGELFTATGIQNLELGWKEDRPDETKERLLPEFQKGEKIDIQSVFMERRQTDPPAHYTDGTILQAMEAAGQSLLEQDETQSGIGTPATRADIIEKLVSGGFVKRVGEDGQIKTLEPTKLAYLLNSVLPKNLKSTDLTANWEAQLSEVEKGTLDPETFLKQIADFIRATLHTDG